MMIAERTVEGVLVERVRDAARDAEREGRAGRPAKFLHFKYNKISTAACEQKKLQ
jgi:hypothetical protein